jgi:hypothetical protein
MPATSKSQRRLMALAYKYKQGKLKNPSKKIKDLAISMSMNDLKDFASTDETDLPEKVDEGIKFMDLLLEYRGPNFMQPLYVKLEELDSLRADIRAKIIDSDLRNTSIDRHFKYADEFIDKAIKYSRLGSSALNKIGADK